jgi:hypothetical protein
MRFGMSNAIDNVRLATVGHRPDQPIGTTSTATFSASVFPSV